MPTDTLMFGPKRELMEVARHRVYSHPDKYVHQIYGENEVGGTGWLYLSGVPFDQIGFQNGSGQHLVSRVHERVSDPPSR